eukprot:SAG11_NODE_1354_length_5128_cov_3.183337_2_plen_260_part_00
MSVSTLKELVAALQWAAAAPGPAEVLVRPGVTIEMRPGHSLLVPNHTTLRGLGQGSAVPVLCWAAAGSAPVLDGAATKQSAMAAAANAEHHRSWAFRPNNRDTKQLYPKPAPITDGPVKPWTEPMVTVGGVQAGLENLVLLRRDLPNTVAVVAVADGADGARIVNINATSTQTPGVYPPHAQVNWTLLVGRASGWVVRSSFFKQDGPTSWSACDGGDLGPDPSPCKMGYPYSTVFHLGVSETEWPIHHASKCPFGVNAD